MKNNLNWAITFTVLISVTFLFSGCNTGNASFNLDGSPKISDETYVREQPNFFLAPFDSEQPIGKEEGDKNATIDVSNTSSGYVVAASKSGVTTKFRVQKGDNSYNYDLDNTGEFEVFPLTMGSGSYTFTIFHNVEGDQYYAFYTQQVEVTLASEFEPFLRPSQIVNYSENSDLVSFTYELTKNATTKEEIVATVYYWITENIDYDYDMAANISSYKNYRPDLNVFLTSKKGICYDYSALFAAMLRINGIPCKLIMGDVTVPSKGVVYHAWNEIWLDGTGWISVQLAVVPNEWMRIDSTFVASGGEEMEDFMMDNGNYVSLSAH